MNAIASHHQTIRSPLDERGVVLPMALFLLMSLMSLTVAFSTLATTEPTLSRNHVLSAQARMVAESGIERATWALQNNLITFTSPPNADYPFNGAQFFSLPTSGGFRLTVTQGAANERNIVAVGWAPNESSSSRGVKQIQVTLMKIREITLPCTLCVMGAVQIAGNANVDSRGNHCAGGAPLGGTMSTGTTSTSGAGKVYGPGNNTPNEPAPEGSLSPDTPAGSSTTPNFSFKFTTEEWAILRSLAKSSGTYLKGPQSFTASRLLPNGLVFVDTLSGADVTASMPTSEYGSVSISANQTWNGWLIAAGNVSVSGSVTLNGMLYAQNDFTFTGSGTVNGGVMTENRVDTASTIVQGPDSELSGNVNLTYSCTNVQTGGSALPTGWFVKPETFVELSGS